MKPGASVKSGLLRAGLTIVRLYPMGLSMFWKAPLVLALVVLPEFVQHVVEIQLGMFGDKAQRMAAGASPTRTAFGYIKVAGLVLAIFAAARFWGARRRGIPWYRLSDLAWGRFAIGFLLFGLVPAIPALFEAQIGEANADIVGIIVTVLMLPAMFLMLAGLLGDRITAVRDMVSRSWPWAVLTVALLVLAFMPAQWLHGLNHKWAFGAHPVVVWALMIFDSLLVGLLAGLTGTAFYLGYATFRDSVSPNPNPDRLSRRA